MPVIAGSLKLIKRQGSVLVRSEKHQISSQERYRSANILPFGVQAHANGRRPHYVVYDGTRDRLDGPDAPHPTSEAGRRLRSRRLAAATRRPAVHAARRALHPCPGGEVEAEHVAALEAAKAEVRKECAVREKAERAAIVAEGG